MENDKRFDSLVSVEPPADLNARILAAATRRARRTVLRRRIVSRVTWTMSAAAAVLVAIGAVTFFDGATEPRKTAESTAELAAMADWSRLEQENYNLYFGLNSGAAAVADTQL